MRLTNPQIRTVLDVVRQEAGEAARIVLYGSRTDDTRRGGDIDLLIESQPPLGLWQRAKVKSQLENVLKIPVDIIAKSPTAEPTPFQAIALATGYPLAPTS
jgi:predicted nucleotidyltransferase